MFISTMSLLTFLTLVAWDAWPTAVLVMSFICGVLLSLQWLVYGLHCVIVTIVRAAKAVRNGIGKVVGMVIRRRDVAETSTTMEGSSTT